MSWTNDRADVFAGAARCVDRQFMRGYLNEAVQWSGNTCVQEARIGRVSLPGHSRPRIELEYDLILEDPGAPGQREITLYARYPAFDRPPTNPSIEANLGPSGLGNILFSDDKLNMSFQSMDRDPLLRQSRQCLDPEFMASKLAGLVLDENTGVDHQTHPLECRLMSYRRGKRLVVRYQKDARAPSPRRLVGKCYADDRGAVLARWHEALSLHFHRQGGGIALPTLIHYDPELRMMLTRWAGRSASRAAGPTESLAAQAGTALAAIHSAPLRDLPLFDSPQQWEILNRWHAAIANLHPSFGPSADRLLEMLDRAATRVSPSPPTAIHRDFYEAQMIINPDAVVILDLDTLALGERCVDLGNCLAHQWLWCLDKGLGLDRYIAMIRSLLDSYESSGGAVDDATLAFHWASALFRVGAVHAFRDETAHFTQPLWNLVEPILRSDRHVLEKWHEHV